MATESVILQFRTTGIPAINSQLTRMQAGARGLVSSLANVRGLLVGIGGTIAFTKASKTIAEFEQTMANVQAVSGATREEFEALEKVARDLGATTVFSARESAQGLVYLSQAGFTATESIESLPKVLQLAQAGGLGLAEASKITANVIRGMNLEVSEASRINDVFAKGASSSNVTVQSLGQSFSFVAPFANALGVSVEQATTAIGKLGDAGLTGGRAGRNMVAFFRQLAKITPEAERILSKYGLTAESVNVQTHGLNQVLRNLQPLIKNTGDTFRIFGAQGALVANILGNNVEGFDELNEKLDNAQGSASEMAKIMSNTLTGSFKAFLSAVTESTLQIGDAGLTGALTSLLKISAGVLSEFNGMGDLFRENTQLTIEQTESIEKITSVLRGFAERLGVVIDAFREITKIGFGKILAGISTGLVAVTVAGKGLVGTITLLRRTLLRFAPALIFFGLTEAILRAGDALNDFSKTDVSPLTSALNGIHSLIVRITQAFSNFGTFFTNIFRLIRTGIIGSKEEVAQAFATLISGSNLAKESVGDIFKGLQEKAQAELNDKPFQILLARINEVRKEFSDSRKTFRGLTKEFERLKKPTVEQTAEFKRLTDVYNRGAEASKRLRAVTLELQQNIGNNEVFQKLRDEARSLETEVRNSTSAIRALKLNVEGLADTEQAFKGVSDQVKDVASAISGGITQGFRDAIEQGKGLISVVDSLKRSFNNLLDQYIEKQLNNFFTSALGDIGLGSILGGGSSGAISKTVGAVTGGLSKINPTSNVTKALNKTVNNYYNQGIQNKTAPQVQIYDQRRNTSAPIETRRSIDGQGNERLKIMIKDEINEAINDGGIDSSFDNRFGIKPRGI